MDEDAKRWLYWAIPIVVVIGAGGALYYARKHNEPAPAPAAQTQAPASVETPVQHPIETGRGRQAAARAGGER